ncbi:MAG: sulfite exporter TauE/SafE family protein [Tissierellaceae bacterium]|nr:sulfite exporter TauE/SafE family protein [Tissierellaceae bacterium]
MILAIIGFFSGIIGGMGIGGGAILIPALVILHGIEQQDAQGVNLIVFLPIAITALFIHHKNGNIEFSYAKPIIFIGIIGSIVGSFIALKIDPTSLRKLFGFFLLFIGVYELFQKKE